MELIALTNFDDFPIDITDSAFEQMHTVLSEAPDCFIRVACKGGGCVHAEQEIGMYDGTYKKAKDVQEGDILVSCQGQKTIVIKKHIKEEDNYELLEIIPTISKTHSIKLTKNHEIFLNGKGFEAASKIKTRPPHRDLLEYVFPSEIIDIPGLPIDLCKIMGYFLAEGSITFKLNKSRTRIKAKVVEFYSGKHEAELLEEIQAILTSLGLKSKIRETRTALCLSSYNTAFATLLEHFCGCNSTIFAQEKEKRLSPEFMLLPPDKHSAFLEYYALGDGSFRERNGRVEFRTSSTIYQLSRQIEAIVARLGILPGFEIHKKSGQCTIEGRTCNQNTAYVVNFSGGGQFIKSIKNKSSFSIRASSAHAKNYTTSLVDFSCHPHEAYSAGGFLIHNCSGLLYDLSLDNEPEEDDLKKEWTREERKVRLIVDLHSASYLKDLTVDYVDNPLGQSGFKFNGGASVKKTCGCGKSFSID